MKAFGFILLCLLLGACMPAEQVGRDQPFSQNWLFSLEATDEALQPDYPDEGWQMLNLPHDWSVSFPFDSVEGEGCTGYLPGGMGWYRKHFQASPSPDHQYFVLFDGVYNRSEVWLNGEKLGGRPYGYVPFYVELTNHLHPTGENVLAVKVDRTRWADSRWYPGSGIYREVKLLKINRLHIPIWGIHVQTPEVEHGHALVKVSMETENDYELAQTFELRTEIQSADGTRVGELREQKTLQPGEKHSWDQEIALSGSAVRLWSPDNPELYTLRIRILQQGREIDHQTISFGIRKTHFDPAKGFFLNGKALKIKGVCLHHDGGLVGAAVPDGVWRRRLQTLKDAGCNAIRISHNPGSEAFLKLCDEMGFMVQEEFFDEWDYPKDKRLNMYEQHEDEASRGYADFFQEWAESDLKQTVRAHRNHPSIIQWSIGNEIEWTYPRARKATGFFDNLHWSGNYFWSQPPYSPDQIEQTYFSLPAGPYSIEKTAQKLANWTRELDSSRAIVANCILPASSLANGYADALDVVGFSYRRVMYDYAHTHYPDKAVMGTENLGQWHEWKAVEERPFISGTFLWTGVDYLGESHDRWPQKSGNSGLLDLAGFPKPSYHMMKSLWQEKPHLYMSTHRLANSPYRVDGVGEVREKVAGAWKQALWSWHETHEHWNYQPGDSTIVEVIANCPEVELFFNGKSLGAKRLSDFPDRIYKWFVPFTPGALTAKGKMGDQFIEQTYTTAGKPVAISLTAEEETLSANGKDVLHLVAQLVDANGNPVRHQERLLSLFSSGPLRLLGVDNGASHNTQAFQANQIRTHQGRALILLQAKTKKGEAEISISSEEIPAITHKVFLK